MSGGEPLIGREPELAMADRLLRVVASGPAPGVAPQAQTLLVIGDAGVGKTTLARAILDHAERMGLTVGVGHCLDVATGTPFAPVIQALRQVVDSRSNAAVLVPPAARWLSSDVIANDVIVDGNALERLLGTTAALAREQPVVMLIEDLHWSDRSTRDYVLSAVRTSRAPVLLVVTTRSDDLTAEHPARQAISDLSLSGATRLTVQPLSVGAIAELGHRRLGRPLSADELDAIVTRSGGNPLYAEEIMTAPDERVPTSLQDLLLRHVVGLSPPAAALVRLASAGGVVIDLDLLHDASGLDTTTFETLAREALGAHVFTRHGDQFGFRHALLRDAIEDGLLPSERVALHGAYVGVLRERAEVGSAAARWRANAALAEHALAANDIPTALVSHVKAGLAAKQHGVPEAADHLESALALWPRVPRAADLAGISDAETSAVAAEALVRSGQVERIRRLLRHAIDRLEHVTDPLAASRVLTIVVLDWIDRDGDVDTWAVADRAIALASGKPGRELAEAWGAKAVMHLRHLEYTQALDAAASGIAIARETDSLLAQYEAQISAAQALHQLGRLPAARAAMKAAVAVAEQAAAPGAALNARALLAGELISAGRLSEARALAQQAEGDALLEGLVLSANFNVEQELTALIWQGHFAEAGARLELVAESGYPERRRRWREVEVLMAVGDLESALATEELTIEENYAPHLFAPSDTMRRVELFEQLGNVARELEAAKLLLESVDTQSPVRAAVRARCGLQALCAARAAGLGAPVGLAEASGTALAVARAGLTEDWAESQYCAYLAMAEAYAARHEGRSAVSEWSRAVDVSTRLGTYFALRPQLEHAGEQLRQGERDAGKESLLAVWRAAEAIGARWFAQQAAAEARRHRVPLPVSAQQSASPLDRLTPRERDVLRLLAQGATNRSIAGTLFISERTTALHVSNILAKLGVANRGEAAAMARITGNA
ncbi:helix-turn-helix transcriptional regulator [Intrasporangium mesophilum]